MTGPSVSLCFPGRGADAHFGVDTNEIRRIASLILRESNPHCNGWTRTNFERRLSKLVPDRVCILILFITALGGDKIPIVFLDANSAMPLTEIIDYVRRTEFSPTFMFLIVDEQFPVEGLAQVLLGLTDAQFVCWAPARQYRAVAALGCEFSRWWGLKSLIRHEVACDYLADRLAILISRLNTIVGNPGFEFSHRMHSDVIAWAGGQVVVRDVDYDKFTSGARVEQYADALKRLADAAYAPRFQHQGPEEHLVSTQAVFWFTELPQETIDFDWLSSTRFSFELFGSRVAGQAPDIQVESVDQVSLDRAQRFLADFVMVPAGHYVLGNAEEVMKSEPPADLTKIYLPEFRIFKRPVTGEDWRIFSRTELDGVILNELPITQCNAFHALMFASLVGRILHETGLIGQTAIVSLPTEQQWEAAARGFDAVEYPWGSSFDLGRCNCDMIYGSQVTKPGLFSPSGDSPFGCQDMAGNVREWTRSYGGVAGIDWQRYDQPQRVCDIGSLKPSDRLVIRGGSYSYDPGCVRTWVRNTQLAERKDPQTGFRLVIEDNSL